MSRIRIVALLALLTFCVGAATASADVQRIKYRFGPIHVSPGQNSIEYAPTNLRPDVPGYITRFKPSLEYADGTVPGVEVIHLHHGVWLINGETRFAVGEEKTITDLPDGYGFRYTPKQNWAINYMIHNLTATPDTVYITYEIDFIPDTDPAAASMKEVHTQWIDVAGPRAYPVFTANRGTGKKGRLTFPDDVPNDPARGPQGTWNVTSPTTLVGTAVHLHPGGLNGYLTVTRNGVTKRLFTSYAHYWEPAGAVSWDVAMTATPDDWRIALKPGDVVNLHVVYDVKKASWYEVMGIMPVTVQDNSTDGLDPFVDKIPMKGHLTHGRLAENKNHGGGYSGLPNPVKQLDGPVAKAQIMIDGFVYGQGDLTQSGMASRPAVTTQGKALTFYNKDAYTPENGGIFHTITACKLPCNRTTGGAYPIANGPIQFDSGELGFGPAGLTPATNTSSWSTPANLPKGTYAYFCRVHPFMRGSFRVVAKKKRKT
jgi:hypothetical protein